MECSSFIDSTVIMSFVKSTVVRFFFIFGSYTFNRRLKILWLSVFIISKKIKDLDCDYGAPRKFKKLEIDQQLKFGIWVVFDHINVFDGLDHC